MATKTPTRHTNTNDLGPDEQLESGSDQQVGTAPRRATATSATAGPVAEPNRRLVVELNRNTASDLAWLVDTEEMNKTNLVNRAVQVYRMVIEAQQNGGGMTIDDPARGAPERVRVV